MGAGGNKRGCEGTQGPLKHSMRAVAESKQVLQKKRGAGKAAIVLGEGMQQQERGDEKKEKGGDSGKAVAGKREGRAV